MSAAERTKDSATKSAPSSAASFRSATSFSVIAGSSGRAYVTLMPLRGASGPGETARVTTSSPCSETTANRGTPSPMTISERSVTSAANFSKSTTTRSCPAS